MAIVSAWLTSYWTWLILFAPTFLVVVLQEQALGARTSWGFAAASTLIQQLAAGVITLAVALWLRRRGVHGGVSSLTAAILICVALGIARGVGGGLAAELLANREPQFSARIISWIVISFVWMMLVSALLSTAQRRWELRSTGRSVRDELGARVRAALMPTIDRALAALSASPSVATCGALSERLGAASERAGAILTSTDVAPESAGERLPTRGRIPAGALIAGAGVVALAAVGVAIVVSVPAVEGFLANGWGIRTAMYFALVVGLATAVLLAPMRGAREVPPDATIGEVAKDLESQLHGPVLGRVSAAAMALSFHAHEQHPAPDSPEQLLTTVREHLAAASADLVALTRTTAAPRGREARGE
jgi:hypothetical protein